MLSKFKLTLNNIKPKCLKYGNFNLNFNLFNKNFDTTFNYRIANIDTIKLNQEALEIIDYIKSDMMRPKKISIFPEHIENNHYVITKKILRLPSSLHLFFVNTLFQGFLTTALILPTMVGFPKFTDYPCEVLTIFSIGTILLSIPWKLLSFVTRQNICRINMTNFYHGMIFSGKYVDKNYKKYSLLSSHKIYKINNLLLNNYNGNITYLNITPGIRLYLKKYLACETAKDITTSQLENLVSCNRDFYVQELPSFLAETFEKMKEKNYEMAECRKDNKTFEENRNHLKYIKNLLFPDIMQKDYVVTTQNNKEYTLKDYSDYYELGLFDD